MNNDLATLTDKQLADLLWSLDPITARHSMVRHELIKRSL